VERSHLLHLHHLQRKVSKIRLLVARVSNSSSLHVDVLEAKVESPSPLGGTSTVAAETVL
jgi:hypothetical protein